jgi:hypothetical protein
MPVWDEDGKRLRDYFYTYYERSDVKIVLRISNFFQWWLKTCFGMDAYCIRRPNLLNVMMKDIHYNLGIENPILF